jgi:RNA polymerase sigma-70 factor (ECF subfamily)
MLLKRSDNPAGNDGFAHLPDSELVCRFKTSGDNRYFQEVFTRHWRRMFQISRSILKEPASAEDALQSTFERAFREIGRFDESRSKDGLRAWLARICRNICLDELRRRRIRMLLAPLPESVEHPEEGAAGQRVLIREAFEILNNLEEPYRVCYLLRIEGYSYEEISSLTGYSYKEVKTYNRTARRNLMKASERDRT